MKPIYLDYNASTPIDPRVVKEMLPYLNEHFGNPSSNHVFGKKTRVAIEKARNEIANFLSCKPNEIIFTSCGTESNNLALKGIAYSLKDKGTHIITSQIEHPAVINPCKFLEKNGFQISYLPVNEYGIVSPDDVKKTITKDTILISIMHANNETGAIQPIAKIGKIARGNNIYFHTDAAQSIGKIPTNVNDLNVDLLSIAGHKFYAPKGIGALYVRDGILLEPFMHGAGHEFGKRAGTENVASIVGLGKACEIAQNEMKNYVQKIRMLRDKFYQGIQGLGVNIAINSVLENCLPNTLNISFLDYSGAQILAKLGNICAGTGSACHDGKAKSETLFAIGADEKRASGAIRFSLGKFTTKKEIRDALFSIKKCFEKHAIHFSNRKVAP